MSFLDVDQVASPAEHPAGNPDLSATPVLYRSYHRALGLTLSYETNDERIHCAVLASFGPRVEVTGTPDVRIRLFVQHVDEQPGWVPRQPLVRVHSGIVTVTAGRATAIAGSIETGDATGFISESAASHEEFLRTALVQSIVLQMAQARSIVPVHAACLGRDGRSILVRGLSSAGKSTLCYAALKRGYALVAEDVVFLRTREPLCDRRLTPAEVEVHGVPWSLHLLPDAAVLFPELLNTPVQGRVNGERKLTVAVEERFPGQTQAVAALGPHVFVTRAGGGEPRLTRLGRDDAITRFQETAIMHEARIARDHGLWDAFLHFPAYLLESGDDPYANAALLDGVLDTPV
jgi:hypothetical protein